MAAPRPQASGQGTGDGSLAGGLVRIDEDFLAVGSQPHSPDLVLDEAVFGPEFVRAQERHDGLGDLEWAELLHEVQREARQLVCGRVCDTEGWFESGGMQRADAFGQEDSVPVGQGSVGQVAGWTSAAPVESDVDGHARGERVEVGVGARAFDAHDFVEGAHACEGAPPGVHVSGRVDDKAARFDVDVRAVSADAEDAVSVACGVVAGPVGPRVDADADERSLIVNILGRQVGDARPC